MSYLIHQLREEAYHCVELTQLYCCHHHYETWPGLFEIAIYLVDSVIQPSKNRGQIVYYAQPLLTEVEACTINYRPSISFPSQFTITFKR